MEPINVFANIGPTRHFLQRVRERGLAPEVVDFILAWGTTVEARDNASYFTIVRRDLDDEVQRSPLSRRAEGWVLVVSDRGSLITCFHKPNAWRQLRRRRHAA